MNNANEPVEARAAGARGNLGMALLTSGLLFATLLAVTDLAQAQSAAAPAAPAAAPVDSSLTIHGITIYGAVDVGLQYQSHGTPESDYFPAGTGELIQKNSNRSVFTATPSNLGQSKIGLQGSTELLEGWSGVFKLETFFNPTSGTISDALKSIALNNGVPLDRQGTNVDSSIAGQAFGGAAYAGVSSPKFGTLTFGRHTGLLADGVAKYDPLAASQAFSVIGFSGAAAGGGDTQNRRLDQSLKYVGKYGPVRGGGQYQFKEITNQFDAAVPGSASGSAGSAWELDVGFDYAGGSIDAFYMNKKDAISVSALSAAQVAGLPALGFSPSNSLASTISDNTTYSLMGQYSFGAPKILFGYEHIEFSNPSTPLGRGTLDIGGYVLAAVNNAAYNNHKVLHIGWAGVKYSVSSKLDVTGAFYGYHQESFATGANAGCSTTVAAQCSGNLNAVSVVADYRFSKRFDIYAGAMWSSVSDGLANGYLNKSTIDPTIGGRFTF